MNRFEQFAKGGGLFDGRYKLLRPLSTEGGSADVWLALDANTVNDKERLLKEEPLTTEDLDVLQGLMVAIKVYRPKNALDIEGEQQFRDEFKIVYNCHHANLIHPTHFSIFQETPYLVLPYCKKGSSEMLIGKLTDNDDLWKFIGDVSSGLAYLHACYPPIIHQDVKPANVLIDDNHNYAITDFGISANFGSRHQYYYDDEHTGTLAYMAPERFMDDPVPMEESDIWALGATIYEIITGHVPYGEEGGQNQHKGKVTLTFPSGVGADIQRLICACLDYDPQKRPTAKQLSEIAHLKQYPIKKSSIWPKILIPLALIAAAVAVFFLTRPAPEPVAPLERPKVSAETLEHIYDRAVKLADSNVPDSVLAGINLLDSLSAVRYMPAIYELAHTYGWYGDNDTVSMNRKKMLGIQLGNPNVDSRAQNLAAFLPKEDKYNQKAIRCYERIGEQPDTAYNEMKMDAAYRLGIYYLYYTRNVPLARKSFLKSQELATQLKDQSMLDRIAIALSEL